MSAASSDATRAASAAGESDRGPGSVSNLKATATSWRMVALSDCPLCRARSIRAERWAVVNATWMRCD